MLRHKTASHGQWLSVSLGSMAVHWHMAILGQSLIQQQQGIHFQYQAWAVPSCYVALADTKSNFCTLALGLAATSPSFHSSCSLPVLSQPLVTSRQGRILTAQLGVQVPRQFRAKL
jgi:hypothetical protein